MKYLCVLDVDLAEKLNLNGATMLHKTQDVKGYYVWVFDANRIPFDISDAVQRGEAFFSTTMRIAF